MAVPLPRPLHGSYTAGKAPSNIVCIAPLVRFVFTEQSNERRLAAQRPQGSSSTAVRIHKADPADQGIPPSSEKSFPLLIATFLQRTAHEAAADVLTALFPTDCLLCGNPMTTLAPERVCAPCVGAVSTQSDTLCDRCGEALGMESARFAAAMRVTECTACRLLPPPFARAASYTAFDDAARELLHLLKFGGQRTLAERVLGQWLAQAMLAASEGHGKEFLVVPVPMFRARERKRGFNQAQLLAASAVRRLRKVRPALRFLLKAEALQRKRDTEALFALTPHQRRRNLKGAFLVPNTSTVCGRVVILVDDIMTTGATARECARVLLSAGASTVLVATVARAQPESAVAHEVWTQSVGFAPAPGGSAASLVVHGDAGITNDSNHRYQARGANAIGEGEDERS